MLAVALARPGPGGPAFFERILCLCGDGRSESAEFCRGCRRSLKVQDKLLKQVPEVEQVFGTVGRGTTPTDNTPMGMVNTTVVLKPRDQWRNGMTFERLQSEMDASLQFPGFPNVWAQPIRNRLDMLLTGIKTPVGIKIFGADLNVIQGL
jgi:copper/silver efflux system protein